MNSVSKKEENVGQEEILYIIIYAIKGFSLNHLIYISLEGYFYIKKKLNFN